jgi:hypothetical protein
VSRVRSLLGFGVEFLVGDDWVSAVGIVLGLSLTAVLADSGPAWWVMPLIVPLLLGFSVWRAARAKA